MSSNRVFQIEKDTTGFMWFVTYMGINRYDGSEIRNYKLSIQDTIEEIYFPSTKMVKDRDGGIWIVLYTGKVFRYNKNIDDLSVCWTSEKTCIPTVTLSLLCSSMKLTDYGYVRIWDCTLIPPAKNSGSYAFLKIKTHML